MEFRDILARVRVGAAASRGNMFFGLAQSLRSLTRSPIATALDQARQMARRHLETGGPVVSPRSYADHHAVPADFVLPPDIDPDEVVRAIEARLRELGSSPMDAPPLIERRAGGRVVVPRHHILRLGDGKFDRGRRFLQTLVTTYAPGKQGSAKPESGPIAVFAVTFSRRSRGKDRPGGCR